MSTRKSDLVLEIDFDNHDEQDEVIKSHLALSQRHLEQRWAHNLPTYFYVYAQISTLLARD